MRSGLGDGRRGRRTSLPADDQMRARSGHAAHNLAVLKQLTLNLIRLDPTKRKGRIKTQRLIAATSDAYPNASDWYDVHAIALV